MSVAIFEQIASEIGVSPRTVQRILNAPLKDTRPTIVRRARQIQERARQLNYRPNVAARATASGRFDCVSLVRPSGTTASRYSLELSDGIVNELALHDMHLTLHRLPDEKLAEAGFLPKMLRQSMSDGLLVNYTHQIPPQVAEAIDQSAIPTVWLNVKRDFDCVYPDDVAAGRMATEYLIQRGYRKIAYFHLGGSGHYSEEDRRKGYLDAMKAAGLSPQVHEVACEHAGRHHPEAGESFDPRLPLALQWLDRSDRPQAVVTYSSWTALPLLSAALYRSLRPGKDLAITTVDDACVTDSGIPITTAVIDGTDMGRRAVQMLMKKIEEPEKSLSAVATRVSLVRAAGAMENGDSL